MIIDELIFFARILTRFWRLKCKNKGRRKIEEEKLNISRKVKFQCTYLFYFFFFSSCKRIKNVEFESIFLHNEGISWKERASLRINVNTTRLLLRSARMELQGCSIINDILIYYLRENKLDNLFHALSVLLRPF